MEYDEKQTFEIGIHAVVVLSQTNVQIDRDRCFFSNSNKKQNVSLGVQTVFPSSLTFTYLLKKKTICTKGSIVTFEVCCKFRRCLFYFRNGLAMCNH